MLEKIKNLSTGKKIALGIVGLCLIPLTLTIIGILLLISGLKTKSKPQIAGGIISFVLLGILMFATSNIEGPETEIINDNPIVQNAKEESSESTRTGDIAIDSKYIIEENTKTIDINEILYNEDNKECTIKINLADNLNNEMIISGAYKNARDYIRHIDKEFKDNIDNYSFMFVMNNNQNAILFDCTREILNNTDIESISIEDFKNICTNNYVLPGLK